jgi:Ulp1 protease family, C-terminal catalytic domain
MPPNNKPKATKPSKQPPSTNEEGDAAWLKHPARQILKNAFMNGEIPLDWNRRPKDIFDKYKDTTEFEGLHYDLKFQNRLRSIRDIVRHKKDRVELDKAAYEIFRQNFPVRQYNDVGDLRWHGSLAEHFLKLDMKAGKHVGKTPAEFREERKEYEEFSLDRFRKHIDQEKRLWKLQNLLQANAAKKGKGGKGAGSGGKGAKKVKGRNKETRSGGNKKGSINKGKSESESNEDRRIGRQLMHPNSLKSLQPGQWLNDEVINGYLALLNRREEAILEADPSYRPSFCYNCFFWPLVTQRDHLNMAHRNQYCYDGVRGVSRHVFNGNLFALNQLVVPINVNHVHWACAVVSFSDRTIRYLDSMAGAMANFGRDYLKYIRSYLQDEFKKLHEGRNDDSSWALLGSNVTEVPQQRNGYDCGVYMCLNAEHLLRGQPLSYTPAQAESSRERIARALLRGTLDNDDAEDDDDDNDDDNADAEDEDEDDDESDN